MAKAEERRYFRVKCFPPGEHLQRLRAGLVFPKGESVHALTKEQFEAVSRDNVLAIVAELSKAEYEAVAARPAETEEQRNARELAELRAMARDQAEQIAEQSRQIAAQASKIEKLEAALAKAAAKAPAEGGEQKPEGGKTK